MTPLPYAWARAQRALLTIRPDGATLVHSRRTPAWALAEAQRCYPDVSIREVPDDELETLLSASYAQAGDAATVMDVAESEIDLDRLMQDMPAIEDLMDTQDDAPIIRMINALFTHAVRDDASDIHIEVFETHSVVRYRVDGTLRDVVSPRRALHNALISRIKIMANLDIAEKRMP
jgi:general secretion pathway protein E